MRASSSAIKAYLGFGFAMGLMSSIVHGIVAFAVISLVGGLLMKACYRCYWEKQALRDGLLLSETGYCPIDGAHPWGWAMMLIGVAISLAALPTRLMGFLVDLVILGSAGFIVIHMVTRQRLIRQFKDVRIARQRARYGV